MTTKIIADLTRCWLGREEETILLIRRLCVHQNVSEKDVILVGRNDQVGVLLGFQSAPEWVHATGDSADTSDIAVAPVIGILHRLAATRACQRVLVVSFNGRLLATAASQRNGLPVET